MFVNALRRRFERMLPRFAVGIAPFFELERHVQAAEVAAGAVDTSFFPGFTSFAIWVLPCPAIILKCYSVLASSFKARTKCHPAIDK